MTDRVCITDDGDNCYRPPNKCDTCEIKKSYARAFDMHWLGKDDCPYECQYEHEEKMEGGKNG